MIRSRAARSAVTIALSSAVAIVVASNLHLGLVRVFLVLAFLTIFPGAAVLDLALPDLTALSTTVILSVGTSVALDVGVAEVALLTHSWNPRWMVAVLALATISLALARLVFQPTVATAGRVTTLRPATGGRSGSSKPGGAIIRREVVVLLSIVVLTLLIDVAGGRSLPHLLAGALGAVLAGGAGIACVLVVIRSQSGARSAAQTAAFWSAAMLACVVVTIVVVRFLVLG